MRNGGAIEWYSDPLRLPRRDDGRVEKTKTSTRVNREEKKWRDRGWYGRYVSEEEMAEFYKNNPGAERL